MTRARREYFLLIIGLILVLVTGIAVYYIQRVPNRSRDMAEVTSLVTNFGLLEKHVSLSADAETVRNDIKLKYTAYATDALLKQWIDDPVRAPGRLTSSPWPDHIEIDAVSPQGTGYIVTGHVIMMTSSGAADPVQVVMQAIPTDTGWKLAAYQESFMPSTTTKNRE